MNIKDLPPELQALCHKRQIEQGNDGKFDSHLGDRKSAQNFNWAETPEGDDFWRNINTGEGMSSHPMYPKTTEHTIFN